MTASEPAYDRQKVRDLSRHAADQCAAALLRVIDLADTPEEAAQIAMTVHAAVTGVATAAFVVAHPELKDANALDVAQTLIAMIKAQSPVRKTVDGRPL